MRQASNLQNQKIFLCLAEEYDMCISAVQKLEYNCTAKQLLNLCTPDSISSNKQNIMLLTIVQAYLQRVLNLRVSALL